MDITHDTHTTYGLPLDSFFSHLNAHKAKSRLWLDVKNLNAENQAFFAQQIDSLCHAHHINRDRLIIESRDTAALRPLTAHGFYTSYYVLQQALPPERRRSRQLSPLAARHLRQPFRLRPFFPRLVVWSYQERTESLHRPALLGTSHHAMGISLLTLPQKNAP